MHSPKISVIVPVYNSQKYLRLCLQSLAEQTLPDIEVLMVNNNTPDGSQQIMDEFAARDPRFKSFFRKDGMAGGARNEGLKHARGEYVAFVDADDWVLPSFLEVLYHNARQYQADISSCHFVQKDEEEGLPPAAPVPPEQQHLLDRQKDGPAAWTPAITRNNVAWRKIIRTRLITDNRLSFPENLAYEDLAFTTACFLLADKVCFSDEELYIYQRRKQTFSHHRLQDDPYCVYAAFAHIRPVLEKTGVYAGVQEWLEYYILEIICGGENGGNGLLKKVSLSQKRRFINQARDFYLQLPSSLFQHRNAVFRLKFRLLLITLKYRLPRLPSVYRAPLNLFTAISKPFMRP